VEFTFKPTSTLSAEQLAIITITPTPSPEPTATLEPTYTPEPTDAATAIPVATATATTEPTATSIPPTATPYTQEGFESLYDTMLTNINVQFDYTDADFREYVRALLLNQKVFDYVTKDISRVQEMVWARHILVETEAEATAILDRINAGEDFGLLAAELSTDASNSANGGDLGWFTKGQMVKEFETVAFELEIGEISEPVATDYGYHIIQIRAREDRELTDAELEQKRQTAFTDWLAEQRAAAEISYPYDYADRTPDDPTIYDLGLAGLLAGAGPRSVQAVDDVSLEVRQGTAYLARQLPEALDLDQERIFEAFKR